MGVFDLFLAPPACVLYIYIFEDLLEEAFVIKNECKKKRNVKIRYVNIQWSLGMGVGKRNFVYCLRN